MEEVNQTFSLINNKKIDVLELSTILLILASIFSIINLRMLKLPQTIGLMILAIALSISSLLLGLFFPSILNLAYTITKSFDFNFVLINVMLPFLLFAGAISINVHQLLKDKITILFLALFGVLFSTYIIGNLTFILIQLPIFGLESIGITYIDCLLFGALIAPTDPIAVLSIVKKMNLSPVTETRIAGESLFNDGIGVVVFLTLIGIKSSGIDNVTIQSVGSLFATEVIGGIALGALIGYLGLKLVEYIENEHVELEVLLTISMVLLLSVIATRFHLSGPLGVVILGLFLNKHADSKSDNNQEKAMGDYVYKFWHLLDETLNAILFILIGLEIILLFESFNIVYLSLSIITIVIVVATRWIAVSIPIFILSIFKKFEKNTALIITWGGLRGGLSIALALNLPRTSETIKIFFLD